VAEVDLGQSEPAPGGYVNGDPLSVFLHQAMAVIWTHAGLRQNEIFRLTSGCIHEQTDDIVQDDGSIISAGTLCYLDVPAGKHQKRSSNQSPAL
jgi:hypothetical protein